MNWELVIGILSLLLTAATLWFVLLDRAERSRQMRRSAWDFRISSTVHVTRPSNEHVATVMRLTNTGGGTGVIIGAFLVGADAVEENNSLVPGALTSGNYHEFTVQPGDHRDAWLWIAHSDTDDKRFVHVYWIPAHTEGHLVDEHNRQSDALGFGRRSRRAARKARGAVGPGGAYKRSFRRGNDTWLIELDSAANIAIASGCERITI